MHMAKLSIYPDRVNIDLPLVAKQLGRLELVEYDPKNKRVILAPDPKGNVGTIVKYKKKPDVLRVQFTKPNRSNVWGTFNVQVSAKNGKVVLEPANYKLPEEIFG
jgi:hypothetical protein